MTDTWNGLETHMFGDGPELADELLALVLAGTKTATCWDAAEGLKGAEVGKPWAVKNGAGDVRCVLETVELTQARFDQIDAAFAFDEGEDDRSLAAWRAAHQAYFTRNGGFAPDMLLNCERFRLVQIVSESAER
ncbi:ASCH domain-containing protein [uncultured Phenylobacterium sp.]|uniref:ASCH domain-containing protein n=1 Tax=uncultured Phenylobacterium sp. TaxID=349273 RepID=UPI0025DE6B67|nr:ASCH domain-containing protein [uncultured Phenylobacterium sp.]